MKNQQVDTLYTIYRGKCKVACEALQKVLPELRLVRGHYFNLQSARKEPHWWLEDPHGNIIDPTVLQFGEGSSVNKQLYTEFDGKAPCEQCGKSTSEEEGIVMGNGNYIVCSQLCARKLVGV